jgi:hypothetical protein
VSQIKTDLGRNGLAKVKVLKSDEVPRQDKWLVIRNWRMTLFSHFIIKSPFQALTDFGRALESWTFFEMNNEQFSLG